MNCADKIGVTNLWFNAVYRRKFPDGRFHGQMTKFNLFS